MLVNLYKTKTPLALFALPIMLALMALSLFWVDTQIPSAIFSWQTVLINAVQSNLGLHYVVAFLIVYISAVQLNVVVNNYGFFTKNTSLPGFIYALALLSFDQFTFNMLVVGYLFLIVGLGYLFNINRQDPAGKSVFLSALFFGTATVCNWMLAPVLILPWLVLFIFRSSKWREWFMVVVGATIPWLYNYGVYFFVTGSTKMKFEGVAIVVSDLDNSIPKLVLYGFVAMLAIIGSWSYFKLASSQLLVFKKRSRVLFHFIWLGIISYVLGWLIYDAQVLGVIIPLAIVFAVQVLYTQNNFWFNTLLYGWVVLIIVNSLF